MKQGLYIKLDKEDKPIAILYRTKEGYWVWKGIVDLDEAEQIELHDQQTLKEE